MQKELELVQLLASLNEKIDTVEKQLKYSTDLSVKIERLVEDVSSIKTSMSELQFMLMVDGQNMGLVTRVASHLWARDQWLLHHRFLHQPIGVRG